MISQANRSGAAAAGPSMSPRGDRQASATVTLPPDEEDIKFFRERREKMRLITRRSLLVGGAAAAVGLLTLPFLPKGSDLNPDDLLNPKVAQANPQLIRELCLEFYAHPKREYRLAAAVHMGEFKDQEIQTILFAQIAAERLPDVKQALVASIVQHRDAATFARIAQAYWADASIRPTVDQHVMFLDLAGLQTVINQASP